jgi:hypothetical protein
MKHYVTVLKVIFCDKNASLIKNCMVLVCSLITGGLWFDSFLNP